MQLDEHQSKSLLAEFGIKSNPGHQVEDARSAASVADSLGYPVAIKALIPVSGRGKAGAIQPAWSETDVGPAFHRVRSVCMSGMSATRVRIEPWTAADRELYVALSFSEDAGGPVLLFGANGGVDVESETDLVQRIPVDVDGRVDGVVVDKALRSAGLSALVVRQLHTLISGLIRAYGCFDARLIELNPVGLFGEEVRCLDARIIIDDNAAFRQPRVVEIARKSSPRPAEDIERELSGIELVPLGGHIGLVSGGAGMTLAAMDLILDAGEEPACFLDCSANPTIAGYGRALAYLQAAPQVEVVLISIFGGLTRVDKVAKNICRLLDEGVCNKPVVFRLIGQDREAATQTLREHGYTNVAGLDEAVQDAVAMARALRDAVNSAVEAVR